MAASATIHSEGATNTHRYRTYKITHDGSDTGLDISPGTEFTIPIGSYTSYSVSSSTFTFLFPAGTNGEFSFITFLGPTR